MLNFIKNNRLSRAFLQMSGASTVIQIIAFSLTPILSRLYTPDDFGTFGTLCSISSFIAILAAFRYEYAFFILKKNLPYFFLISLGLIAITSLISSIALPFFVNFSTSLIFITIFSTSICNITTQFSVAKAQYKNISIGRITQGSVQYLSALILGVIYLPNGLIYSFIAGQLMASVYLLIQSNISLKKISKTKIYAILKVNSTYCANSTFTSALQWSAPIAPMLAGGFIYSSNALGIYFLVIQAISAVTAIPRRSLISICTSELSSPDKFKSYWIPFFYKMIRNKIFLLFLVLAILVLLILQFWGYEIITFLFGNKWAAGGDYISILVLFCLLDLFIYPFIHLLNLWGKHVLTISIEIPRFIFVFFIVPVVAYYLNFEFSSYILSHFFVMLVFNVITFGYLVKVSKQNVCI